MANEQTIDGLATGETAAPGSVAMESTRPPEADEDNPFEDGIEATSFLNTFNPITPGASAPEETPAPTQSGVPETQVSAQPSPTVPAQQTEVASVPPPTGTPQTAATPAQGAPAEVPSAAPQTGQQPAQSQPSEEDAFRQLDTLIEAQRPKVVQAVAQQSYQLTTEQIEALTTEPEVVIPQLLAQVHVNAVQGVLRHVTQNLPGMLNSMLQVRERHQAYEDDFWKMWPQLDRAKHRAQVQQVGVLFRKQYPQADAKTFSQFVGAQVMLMNGLHQMPAAPRPTTPAAQTPFRPAGAGLGGGPVQPGVANGWDVIAQAMQEE